MNSVLGEIPNTEEELLQEVIKLEDGEKYHTALRLVEDFLQAHPDSFQAKIYRCGLLNNTEYSVEEVKQCLDEVTSLDPTNLYTMLNYGILYYRMDNFEKSRDQFTEILERHPDNVRAKSLFYTVSMILEPNNTENLIKLKELARETGDIQALDNVITFLNAKNDFKEADRLLKISEEIDDKNPNTLTNRGVWYAKQGDLQTANRYFADALEEDPDNVGILNNLGLLYRDLGDDYSDVRHYQSCIEYYESVLTLDSENIFAKDGQNHCSKRLNEIASDNVYFQLGLALLGVSATAIFAIITMHLQDRKAKIKKREKKYEQEKGNLWKRLISSGIFTIIFTGALMIPLILAAIIVIFRIPITDDWDVANWATLIVEIGIGIIVATVVLAYELSKHDEYTKQQNEITDMMNKLNKIEDKQSATTDKLYEMIDNENKRIQGWKLRWGTVIREELTSIQQLYIALGDWIEEYSKKPTPELKSNIINTAKRNGEIVKVHVQNIVHRDLSNIESYFDDPVLGLNIKSLCEQYPAIFYSFNENFDWESNNLQNTLGTINEMKKVLDRDIKRLNKEISHTENKSH